MSKPLDPETTRQMLEETSMDGYVAYVLSIRGDPEEAPIILGMERQIRERAETHGIDLAPYPNAFAAERHLANP